MDLFEANFDYPRCAQANLIPLKEYLMVDPECTKSDVGERFQMSAGSGVASRGRQKTL